ncbi:ionotropic receptor 75a-like isoform 2-T3 [Cochliomyia hominivorax]
MFNPNFLSLILHHFLNAKLACVVLFHCWNKETVYQFSNLSSHYGLYTQYVNMDNRAALANFSSRYMRHDRPQIGIFMDMNCNRTEDFIDENSHLRLFNYRYRFLVYDEISNFSRFYNIFKSVNLSVDTRLTYVVPKYLPDLWNATKTSYITFDVYNNGWLIGGAINITTDYEIECYASYCKRTKYLSNLYKRPLYGNRESLRDVIMRVALVVTRYPLTAPKHEILEFLFAQKDFHIDPLSRLGILIFQLLIETLYTRIDYEYYDRWTDMDYTGGVVGALVNETADLVTSPFFMTPGRFQFLAPLSITGTFGMVCMFRTPQNSGIQGHVFIEPFSPTVWIIFGVILGLYALFLWLTFFVEFHHMKPYIDFAPSLLTTCFISFASSCLQGSFVVPGTFGGRFGYMTLLIICFLMYNYYTSIVVSSLLGSPVKSNLKTLADLANSDLEVGLESWPYMYTYLNFSTLPDVRLFVRRKVESKKILRSPWYTSQEGITKMREKPGFVFIFETSTGYNMIENQYHPHEICDLNKILFRPDTMLATHVHKNSSYKELFRLKLMRILETGVHSKHRRLWVRTSINCLDSNFLLTVGMEYAAPLFLLLVGSYLLCFFIFLLEILWSHVERKRKNMEIIERQAEEFVN